MSHQYLVVVPRNAADTLADLIESFKSVAHVEVIVDRRRPSATLAPPAVERRASDGRGATSEAFGCTLVRLTPAATAPDEARAPGAAPGVARTLEPIRLRTLPLLRER